MNFIKRMVRDTKPLPIFIVFLAFEIGIWIFYSARISDLIQDRWTNAYELVFGTVEFHLVVAGITSFAVMLIPCVFYFVLERKTALRDIGGNIFNILTGLGNIAVFGTEMFITKLIFESNQDNVFTQVSSNSSSTEYALWGLGFIIAVVHQLGAYILIQSILAIKDEDEE